MEESILISASYDKQIRFWNTTTGDTMYYFTFQDSQINTLLYIPETQFLAVAGYGVIRLYSFASPSPTSLTGNLQRSTTHFSDVANNVNTRMMNVNDVLPAGMGNTGFGVANVHNGMVAGKVGGAGAGAGAMRGIGGVSGSGAAGRPAFPNGNQAPLLFASYERTNSLNFTSLGYFTLESESSENYNHDSDEAMLKYMSNNVTKIGSNEQLMPTWHIPVDELGATVVLPEQHRRNCKLILFATSEDGHIVFFDAQSQTTLRPIKDIATGVAITCSSLSPNRKYLLTGNQIGLVSVWHLPSIIASVQTSYNDTHKTECGLTKLEQDNRTRERSDTDDTTKREKNVINCRDLNKSNINYTSAKEWKEEIKLYGSKPIQVISFDNNYSAIRSIAIEPLARWAVVATNVGRLHFIRFARDVNLSGSKSHHEKSYKSTSVHTRNQSEHVLDSVKSTQIGETISITTSHEKTAPTVAIHSSSAKNIIDDKATAAGNDKEEADVFNTNEAKGQMQHREGNEKESEQESNTELDNKEKIVLQSTAEKSQSVNKMHESDVKHVRPEMNIYHLNRKITVDTHNTVNNANEIDDNTCALRNLPKQSVYQSALAVNEINEQVMHSAERLDDENDDGEFENTEGHVSNTSMGTALLETLTQLHNSAEESHHIEHYTNDHEQTKTINEDTLCSKEEVIKSETDKLNETRREAESTDEVCENDLIAENKETCFAAKNAKSAQNLEEISESKELSLREQMEMEVFHSFNAHYKYILKVGINQTGDLLVTCSADYSVGRFVIPECLRVFVENNTLQELPTSEDKKALQENATEMESENKSQTNTQRGEKYEKLKETSNEVSSATPMHSNSTVAHVLKSTNKEENNVGHTLLRPERSERENSSLHSGEIRVDNDNICNVNDTTLAIATTNVTQKTGLGVNCSVDHSRNTEDELSSYASSNVTSSLADGGHGSNTQIKHSTKHHFNNLYFKPLKPLAGHNRWVWDCAFGDCGRYLFTASSDNTIRKWSNLLSDSVEYTTFTGHSKPVIALTMYKHNQQQLYKAK